MQPCVSVQRDLERGQIEERDLWVLKGFGSCDIWLWMLDPTDNHRDAVASTTAVLGDHESQISTF